MIKERIRGSILLLPRPFFFQANVLVAKEKSSPVTIFFLQPKLRVNKLRRFLCDRNVSQVHSFQKRVHDRKLIVEHFALTDNFFQVVSVFPLFLFH